MNLKSIFFLIILLLSINTYSQNNCAENFQSNSIDKPANNELKINLAYVVAAIPEITYERILKDNMGGLGFSAAFSLESINDNSSRYIFLPYYRLYFGKKKGDGFFIEGNMAFVGTESRVSIVPADTYFQYDYTQFKYEKRSYINLGLGVAIGFKLFTRNNYFGELYAGAGRLQRQNDNTYPRCGITLGKRF